MNKEIYIDIIEKAISVYGDERIDAFIKSVHKNGLTEHGFPRLIVAMGILLAFGRCEEYRDKFLKNMDFCCEQIPVTSGAGNNFSVREICTCIELLRENGAVEKARTEKWIADLRKAVPEKIYDCCALTSNDKPHNWAVFAAVSEIYRDRLCGVDTTDYIELQLGTQICDFNDEGMYMDPDCPVVYDAVPRILYALAFRAGYKGASATAVYEKADKAGELTLKMQSVNGEFPFGGRSNQFLHNEMDAAVLCEYHATRLKDTDIIKAGQYKAAAELACNNLLHSFDFYNSHIKNRFDTGSFFGCENYGYFDKYMITTASFAFNAYLLATDGIQCSPLPSKECVVLNNEFHKIFARGYNWFLEFDTDADLHYDANGLGRIHKAGCPGTIALSVPFPSEHGNYKTENKNIRPMSLCVFKTENGKKLYGASVPCEECSAATGESSVTVSFSQRLGGSYISQEYKISEGELSIRHNGGSSCGFCLPVIDFDGRVKSNISEEAGSITVEYEGCICRYTFNGSVLNRECYENRNGRYLVFDVSADTVNAEISYPAS